MQIDGTYKLVAYEPEGLWKPVLCEFVKTASCGDRDDLVWVELQEPRAIDLPPKTQSQALLAGRHVGYDLINIDTLPVHVYVLKFVKEDWLLDKLNANDISISAWALLVDRDEPRTDLEYLVTRCQ